MSDKLGSRILLGLGVGVAAGLAGQALQWAYPGAGPRLDWLAREVLAPFGSIFLRLLFFVVVPLVFASLCLGVSQLGRLDRMGGLAIRTFSLFLFNMAVGVALGLVFMNLVEPGAAIGEEVRARLMGDGSLVERAQSIQQRGEQMRETGFGLASLIDMFLPANLLGAVAGSSPDRLGNVLALILFALLCGAAATQLERERRLGFEAFLATLGELMTTIVFWAMKLAPFAVAALVASTVLRFGLEYLQSLALFTAGVVAIISLHLFGTLALLIRVLGGRSPIAFFKAIRTILVTAFSTSSSNATLPTTIAVTRERLGVSAPVAGFVLPLGATLNMSGSALYEGCVVLFVAQAYGIEMALGEQVVLLCLAVLSAVAVAGIPGGTLPFIVGLLAYFGIPAEGIALVLGVDRLLDMCRTALNVGADVVVACIVDRQVQGQAPESTG